jgi:hypothetical protein
MTFLENGSEVSRNAAGHQKEHEKCREGEREREREKERRGDLGLARGLD